MFYILFIIAGFIIIGMQIFKEHRIMKKLHKQKMKMLDEIEIMLSGKNKK